MIELIPHHYYETYNLYQGTCYQQYGANLCGYHATFNTLCALNLFSHSKGAYDIQSRTSFWKFKLKVEAFLLEIKKANKLRNEWPWR